MALPSKAQILSEIQLMMKELFQVEPDLVQPGTRLTEDLDLDSLDAMDLAVKVEDVTGVPLDEAKIPHLKTIEDVIVMIDNMIRHQGAKFPGVE
ncbi:MAG TPA: acyl carrier protein [Kofleriaceae bacterium]|jgi:acyl carrier protein